MARSDGKRTAARIAAAIGSGELSGPSKIAQALQISRSTVHRHLRDIAPALEEAEKLREEYRAQLRAETPVQERAGRLGALIAQNDQQMVALKAIMYTDRLLRVAPEAEMPDSAHSQPLFTLPPGARVAVKVD